MTTPRPVTTPRRRGRVRAPELHGAGGWVGAAPDLTLRSLRGRLVLLDFTTPGCVNCVHVLEELRPLARRWADELVVLGVHSPKFAHEATHAALLSAVARLGVDHPVLDDPELRTWDAYAVKAWPTLVLVDPAGYVVHVAAGEGHAAELDAVIAEVVAEHRAAGTLVTGADPARPLVEAEHALRHPARAVATAEGTLLVADTGHAAVVELAADLSTELRRWTGPFGDVSGLAVLPPGVAAGADVVVADRLGQRLHLLDRRTGATRVLAGTGEPWRPGDPADGPAAALRLSSPTDVAWWPALGALVVAQAGNHTLAALDLGTGALRRLAGRVTEGLGDGPAPEAFLAQPTGLAVDGDRLWFVDAESSALRWLADGVVRTAVGAGLFDFGHVDGPADRARLQHPQGLAVLADGSVAVADTYDGAVRRFDPRTGVVGTLADGLDEPTDVVLLGGRLLVVAGHEVAALPGDAPRPAAPVVVPVHLAPGPVELAVALPAGATLDPTTDVRLDVVAEPPGMLGATHGEGLTRTVAVTGPGVLHVRARVALCDPVALVCRLAVGEWRVAVRTGPDPDRADPVTDPAAGSRVVLRLGGG